MLRNTTHLKGFAIRATDGELGTVDQFYFDDETWAIRYLMVEHRRLAWRPAGADLANCPSSRRTGKPSDWMWR